MCICFVICPSVSCYSSRVSHLCCCYSSGVPCFNIQVSLPYNKLIFPKRYAEVWKLKSHEHLFCRFLKILTIIGVEYLRVVMVVQDLIAKCPKTSVDIYLRKLCRLTLILRRSRTGTVWFYTSTSNKRAARPKLYTKSLTGDLKLMHSRFTLVRISIKL